MQSKCLQGLQGDFFVHRPRPEKSWVQSHVQTQKLNATGIETGRGTSKTIRRRKNRLGDGALYLRGTTAKKNLEQVAGRVLQLDQLNTLVRQYDSDEFVNYLIQHSSQLQKRADARQVLGK